MNLFQKVKEILMKVSQPAPAFKKGDIVHVRDEVRGKFGCIVTTELAYQQVTSFEYLVDTVVTNSMYKSLKHKPYTGYVYTMNTKHFDQDEFWTENTLVLAGDNDE